MPEPVAAVNVTLSSFIKGQETPINPATTALQVSFNDTNVDAELKALRSLAEGQHAATVVADISARDALKDMQSGDICWVQDATGDEGVASGAAMYVYDTDAWKKVAEAESLDVVLKWAEIQDKPTSQVTDIDKAANLIKDVTKTAAEINALTNYTHPNTKVTPSTYRQVTVDQQGHITAGENPTVAIGEGGTGATSAEGAVTALGFTKTAAEISAAVDKIEVAVLEGEAEVPAGLKEGGLIIRTPAAAEPSS